MTTETKTYLERAIEDGHLRVDQIRQIREAHLCGRQSKLQYAAGPTAEEKVRAEFYAWNLSIAMDIRLIVSASRSRCPDARSPNDYADLVVFRDDERKRFCPSQLLECKKE